MEADTIPGTCSMSSLYEFDDIQSVEDQIEDSGTLTEPASIACLDAEQMKNAALLKALDKTGFKKFGTYGGRASQVTVFLRGVTKSRS